MKARAFFRAGGASCARMRRESFSRARPLTYSPSAIIPKPASLLKRYLAAEQSDAGRSAALAKRMKLLKKAAGQLSRMQIGEAFSFSFQALRQNPVRSFLTGLGMVIGTASVILVVTISLTSQNYILEQIEGVGSNMIFASYEVGTQESQRGGQCGFHQDCRTCRRSGSSLRTASWPPPASKAITIRCSSTAKRNGCW